MSSLGLLWLLLAQDCGSLPPLAPIAPRGTTIFTEEQEGFLGETVARQLHQRPGFRIFRQPGLTAPLEGIATRLQHQLPAHRFTFTFTIVELPDPTAFVLPGGRIYVSRKLIAFVENEDELAGVLAHEMGHVFARQASIAISKDLKDLLKVTTLGGREDVQSKFRQLAERKSSLPASTFARKYVDNEVDADRISLQALARAGYDPQALTRFLDRLTGNNGVIGNALQDWFGMTRPESKRIRELLKGVAALPQGCSREAQAPGDFRTWQKQITELPLEADQPPQPAVTSAVPSLRLNPPLRPEIRGIYFTPDGQRLLAQDEGGIHVLSVTPLQHLFRIPARDAGPPVIDAESRTVAFRASGMRVEVWDLRTQARRSIRDVFKRGCRDGSPSPGGRYFVCQNFSEITLLDLESGKEAASKHFRSPPRIALVALISQGGLGNLRELIHVAFSPSGTELLASPIGGSDSPWAYDLGSQKEILLPKPVKTMLAGSFAFVRSNQLAVMNAANPGQSALFEWPSGRLIGPLPMPNALLSPAAQGPYVIVRPHGKYAAAIVDVERKEVLNGSQIPVIDRHGPLVVSERVNGEIGLYGEKSALIASVRLPGAELGAIRGGAHSPDLDWLMLSSTRRSGFWKIQAGTGGVYLPFEKAWIGGDQKAYVEYEVPATQGASAPTPAVERNRQWIRVDLEARKSEVVHLIPPKTEDRSMLQGRYRVKIAGTNAPRNKGNLTLVVSDAVTRRELWDRDLEGGSVLPAENAVVLLWPIADIPTQKHVQSVPHLKRQLAAMPGAFDRIALVRAFSLQTGTSLGETLIDTYLGGSIIWRAAVAGDKLLAVDINNQATFYSLATGARLDQDLGKFRAVDPVKNRFCMEAGDGRLRIWDATELKEIAAFEFGEAPIAYTGFSGDGSRLLVVTAQQQVFIQPVP